MFRIISWVDHLWKTAFSAQTTPPQKKTAKAILRQLYSGNPPSEAFHAVCSGECVARLAVVCADSPPPLPVKPFQQRLFAHSATV